MAIDYVRVYAPFSPATTMMYAIDNFLRICGYIRWSLVANILFAILGTILELLFLGPLGMGVKGSAASFSPAMIACTALCLIPFLRGRTPLKFCKPRIDRPLIKQIAACGAPTFLNNIAGRPLSIVMNMALVAIGGEVAVSVWGVLMHLDGLVQPLLHGMCDSLQPAVGYNLGAGRYDRVWAIERCCFFAAAAVSLTCGATAALAPEQPSRLFLADIDATTLAMATGAVRLFSLTYLTRWVSHATQSCLLAVEMPLPASIISIAASLIVPLALVAVL